MTTKPETETNRQPTHVAYHVPKVPEGIKARWTRIGAVWTHSDGKGFNLDVDLLPRDGRITVREIDAKNGQEAQS